MDLYKYTDPYQMSLMLPILTFRIKALARGVILLAMCVSENIHTHLREGKWKFQGGGGLKTQILSMKVWNKTEISTKISGGRGQTKNTLHGRGQIFSTTMQIAKLHHVLPRHGCMFAFALSYRSMCQHCCPWQTCYYVKCYFLVNAKLCPPPHPIAETW